MKNQEDRTGDDHEAVSSVIGTVLIASLTVLVAAVIATFVPGVGGALQDTDTASSAGIEFNYDYEETSDRVKITVQDPGNTERLYVAKVGGGFKESDIVETRGWQENLGGRDGMGRIVNGSKLVNNDTRAGDDIIVDNVTQSDDFIVTADKGVGTDATVINYWESNDWSYNP